MNIAIDKYLIFNLEDERYAIPVSDTKEIVRMMGFTSVPKAPEFIKGVINIRSKIIPLIDLRIRFGLSTTAVENDKCVFIIIETTESGKPHTIALMVDNVPEIAIIKPDEIESPSELYNAGQMNFLSGTAKNNGRTIWIIKSNGIMGTIDTETVNIAF
jgi:purine-binding chemotaxis protein CheW